MLLRDNTSRYLYILLASSIIKVELKKCVVHEVGRMRLHLWSEDTKRKWIVCLTSYQQERLRDGKLYSWGGSDWAIFLSEKIFFSVKSGKNFFSICSVCFVYVNRSARFVWLLFLMQSKALCDYLPRVKNNEVKQFKSVALPGPCAQETQSTLPSDAQRCGWTLLREPCKSSCPHPELDLKHA